MPQGDQQYSPGQLDAIARERGFPDYATWMAWHQKYRAPVRGQGQPQPQQKNWLQSLVDKIPIHPSYLFNYVSDKIDGATRKNQ